MMDLVNLLLLLLFSSTIGLVIAPGPALGEVDQIYYGVWVDTDIGFSDTPILYNTRLARNASVFHIAQLMPLSPYNYTTGIGGPAPEYLIENTATDACVFLTVYPSSLSILTDADYHALGIQLMAYQKDFNRTVFLRWAPEMQGRWNPYGQQPSLFTQAWQAMYRTVKALAPLTIVVWAPNLGHDYPYGQTDDIAAEDLRLLDTNNNGRLDAGDDPYTPYYPGDDYVDWIGLSIYFKQFSRNINFAQPPGYCSDILTGIDSYTRVASGFDWYTTYCLNKPNKACLIAESGAAYHVQDTTSNSTQLEIQRAWWQDCITNTTFLDLYPRLKLHMHFEFSKVETDNGQPDIRDYRLTNTTEVLQAFQTDLNTVQDRYLWAQYRKPTRPIQLSGPGISAPATATPKVPVLVLQTLRNPQITGLPTLFGVQQAAIAGGTIGIQERTKKAHQIISLLIGFSGVILFIGGGGLLGRARRRSSSQSF